MKNAQPFAYFGVLITTAAAGLFGIYAVVVGLQYVGAVFEKLIGK